MKVIIVVALIAVLIVLASAGVFMLRRDDALSDGQRDKRMARTLALRVGLSIALFVFVLLAWWLGWIAPTGLPVSR